MVALLVIIFLLLQNPTLDCALSQLNAIHSDIQFACDAF